VAGSQSLKVLFVAAEASPLVKVGGLADVAGALPQELRDLGCDVRLALPHYASLTPSGAAPVGRFSVSLLGRTEEVTVSQVTIGKVPVYLLANQKYFGRPAVYGEADDLERFLLFAQAALQLPKLLGWAPDVFHCHDWHAAGACVGLSALRQKDPLYSASSSICTVHNLGYQGWFDDSFAGRAGLHPYMPPADHPLRSQSYSLLALALLNADIISTVSPTYAKEILTPEYGEKLDGMLRTRADRLRGILNGIDYREFDPATDRHLAARFDASTPELRAANKAALQQKAGLPRRDDVPVLGMVGRLAAQKGVDLVGQALGPLLQKHDVQFVWLGTGEEKYRVPVEQAVAAHPDKAKLIPTFDLALAQLIYGGSDVFLMPSKYEPCGLGQLIALRYGAIPVVRRTGGLADTIQDCDPALTKGNGFVFDGYTAPEFVSAIERALAAFKKKAAWKRLMARAMKDDFSWGASAKKYLELYREASATRKKDQGTRKQ